ncbi:TRAP transporter small permease [Bacillus piscicola]|uniref:TRAP transporter small permease n=1 Tax=Bacillus piscicola TaxID=1632684 RepID=UPI001F08FACF|nr:TRAP transporter small permease [Bacillus piscicola]
MITLFSRLIKGTLILLMVMMVFSVGYGVFTRYVLDNAASWTGELSSYILVWVTFLGSSWAVIEKKHINVDILTKTIPFSLQLIIKVGVHVSLLIFSCLLVYFGTIVSIDNLDNKALTLPITMGLVYCVIPISGLIMFSGFAKQAIQLFTERADSVH